VKCSRRLHVVSVAMWGAPSVAQSYVQSTGPAVDMFDAPSEKRVCANWLKEAVGISLLLIPQSLVDILVMN